MEVAVTAPPMDFNFDSACSSPYVSVPSSPKRLGHFYFSAPTSPAHASDIYRDFNDLSMIDGTDRTGGSSLTVPFSWEEKPGKPKSNGTQNSNEDFAFDFSGQSDRASLSAEELFDGGVIRPLKPPPRTKLGGGVVEETTIQKSLVPSPRSPRSPTSQGKKMFRDHFSPRHKKKLDPFEAAIEQTGSENDRGRERVLVSSASKSGRRATRSLSPLRISEVGWEDHQQNTEVASLNSKPSSSSLSSSSFKGHKKWRLKDFFLFRSASEGRASEKDPLRKYTALSKKHEDVKNSGHRSTEIAGTVVRSRRNGPVSAHELHYTLNRAVSEELRKKTFLPYKQGILGVLGFSPTVHGLPRSFGSVTRG